MTQPSTTVPDTTEPSTTVPGNTEPSTTIPQNPSDGNVTRPSGGDVIMISFDQEGGIAEITVMPAQRSTDKATTA